MTLALLHETQGKTSIAPEDAEELVDLRVPGEERLLVEHLRKDAPDGPGVHLLVFVVEMCKRSRFENGYDLGVGTRCEIERENGHDF